MMLRHMIVVLISSALLVKCASCQDNASKNGWTYAIGVDVFGKYVWRGINYTDGMVFQPSFIASNNGLNFSLWGNIDASNVNGRSGDLSEVDYSLEYGWTSGKLDFSTGFIYYDYPGSTDPSTGEIYASISFKTLLSPCLKVYRDCIKADGFSGSFELSHSFEKAIKFSEKLFIPLDLTAEIGFADKKWCSYYHGLQTSGITDALLTLSTTISSGKFSLTPSINYSSILKDSIRAYRNSSGKGNNDNFWIGLSFNTDF